MNLAPWTALFFIAAVLPAMAVERTQFDAAAFKAAQEAGRPVLVHVTAPWCGTCRRQKPIIDKFAADPGFADLALFDVDYDSQKDAMSMLGARAQSTMVMFKGPSEVGRSVGDTKAASIEALMRKGL